MGSVGAPTEWAGALVIRSLALETPFNLEPMHRCPFTLTHLLVSSGCAKLIPSEALTLSRATMSGGENKVWAGGGLSPGSPIHAV